MHHSISFKKAVARFIALKWKYLTHRYQVCNDSYYWPQILNTIGDLEPIYHMDYSENITQSIKYEPQEPHFNKKQYSLHCTVKHEEDKSKYFYNFSDELNHNFAFTYSVVKHLIHLDPELEIIRIKSDNCSTKCASKNIFGKYKQLASEKGIPVICYHGVSSHGFYISLPSHFHLIHFIYQSSSTPFLYQNPTHSFCHSFPSHSFYRS